ncbi:unnamed protein product [Calypogeia fissa]
MPTKVIERWHEVTHGKKAKKRAGKFKPAAIAEDAEGMDSGGIPRLDYKACNVLQRDAKKVKTELKAMQEVASGAEEASDSDRKSSDGEGKSGLKENWCLKMPTMVTASIPEAAAAIDIAELSAFLSRISEASEAVPRNQQLIMCADYFVHAFSSVNNNIFSWKTILLESRIAEIMDIPYSYLPETLVKTTSKWLALKPIDKLSKFTVWLLKELLDVAGATSSSSSKPKVGLLVLLALVLRKRPEALAEKADTMLAFLTLKNLPILAWVYAQAAQADLAVGMALWVQNLLPLAIGEGSNPTSKDIALQFIENVLLVDAAKARKLLVDSARNSRKRLVPPAALDTLMRATFLSNSSETKGRFQPVYPFLKELALAGSSQSKATKRGAQQLLPLMLTATEEGAKALQEEAFGCFLWCLAQGREIYKEWERLHLENLEASTRILNHINGEWKQNSQKRLWSSDNLKGSLEAFHVQHQNARKSAGPDERSKLNAAELVTQLLLSKTRRISMCAAVVTALAVSAGSTYICFRSMRYAQGFF